MRFSLAILLIWICFNSSAQTQIYVSAFKNIYVVNPAECTSVLKGTSKQFWDIAFTTDGKLWGIDEYGLIHQIDTSNADTTFIMDTELYTSSLEGFGDSCLLAVSEESLYKINLYTSAVTLMGNIGYRPSGDMVWYDNYLFLNADYLIRVQLDFDSETIIDVQQMTDYKYDGMDGYAMGALPVNDSTNGLFVFDRYDLYQVCQIDGSTKIQCTSLLPFFAYGAASMRLPVQNPEPTHCRTMIDVQSNEIQYLVNPVDEFITIYSNSRFENVTVNLYDATGQLVRANSDIDGTEFSFSIQNLATGFYILQIEGAAEAHAHKLMLY